MGVQQIQSSMEAFAAIRSDGKVVTWGAGSLGGDSSMVQGQLRNVTCIQATSHAFAAVRSDGSVVTWGHRLDGGDSSHVREELRRSEQEPDVGNLQEAGAQAKRRRPNQS